MNQRYGGNSKAALTELLLNRLQNFIASVQPAGGCGTNLDVVLANGSSDEHGVEGGHLVDSHVGHAKNFGNLVHG